MKSKALSTINSTVKKATGKQAQQKTQPGGPTIAGVQGVGKQSLVKRPLATQSTKAPSPVRVGFTMGEAWALNRTHHHDYNNWKKHAAAVGVKPEHHHMEHEYISFGHDSPTAHIEHAGNAGRWNHHEHKGFIDEGKENERDANLELSGTFRMMKHKQAPKTDDYFSYLANKGAKKPAPKPVKEETIDEMGGGGGGGVAMSVGSGAAVPTITDPTTNYAFQRDRNQVKRYKALMAKRKKPTQVK